MTEPAGSYDVVVTRVLDTPLERVHVVRFRDLGAGRTELTVTEHGYTVESARDRSQAGLEQCVDKLAAGLAQQQP